MTRDDLRRKLVDKATDFSELKVQVDGAALCSWVIGELDALWRSEDSEWVTASVAAARSGYSEDHLRKLGQKGLVTRKSRTGKSGGRYRYLMGSLPIKQSRKPAISSFDASQAAREVLNNSASELRKGSKQRVNQDSRTRRLEGAMAPI